MANQFLASFKFGAESDEKEEVCRTAVAKICVKVHTSINETGDRFYNELRRKTYTTPKSYLDLIGMYSSKLGELQGQVDVKIEQMEVGCAKLAETNAVVDGLRGTRQRPESCLVSISRCRGAVAACHRDRIHEDGVGATPLTRRSPRRRAQGIGPGPRAEGRRRGSHAQAGRGRPGRGAFRVLASSRVATRLDIEKESTPGLVRWRRVASMA